MPTLSNYFKSFFTHPTVDPSYRPQAAFTFRAPDLNGDGHQDLLVLGGFYPGGSTNWTTQPGRLLLGDGKGGYTIAGESVFPNAALSSVHPRKVIFADFNGDGRADVFIADHGWDAPPFPGQQNQLFLSKAGGGYDNATARLSQVSDFTHAADAADIDGDGDVDIFVGNGYGYEGDPLSYMLINDGAGNFTRNDSTLPVHAGGLLDFMSVHHFPGATLADLNGDGLPELLVTADAGNPYDKLRNTTIIWNQKGVFKEDSVTMLPLPAGVPAHIDLDVQMADFNYDGRPDLIVVGTNGDPYYKGAFVQLLRNDGNNVFTDVTASSMPAADVMSWTPGSPNDTPWGMWLQQLDFNHDGVMDFAVNYNGQLKQSTPLVWLNDGAGKFTVLHVSDFVEPGSEWMMNTGHFVAMEHGYGHVTTQYSEGGGLLTMGLAPLMAYRGHAASPLISGDAGANQFATTGANNTVNGGAGLDTLVMSGNRAHYTITVGAQSVQVSDGRGIDGTDTLTGVERVRFLDQAVAFDIEGVAGMAYRVYQAAFGRTPDLGGLGFWIGAMDRGSSLHNVAAEFSQSAEFKALYGTAPTNRQIVEKFYTNVLHRPGETAGIEYWSGVLDQGLATVAEVLVGFSESPENKAALTGVVSNGIGFTPFG